MNDNDQAIRHEKWKALIEEQEKSGLSQANFCKERNISSAQLEYYRSILKPKQESSIATFTPVKINQQTSTEIRLTLPNGFHCVFPQNINTTQMKELIRMLLSC